MPTVSKTREQLAKDFLDKIKADEKAAIPSFEELKTASQRPKGHFCDRCVETYTKWNKEQFKQNPDWEDKFPICKGSRENPPVTIDEWKNIGGFHSEEEAVDDYFNMTVTMDPVKWAAAELNVIMEGYAFDRDGDKISMDRWHQKEVLHCSSTYKTLRMGRRGGKCIEEGTPVMTPAGPVEIQKLKIGDIVYSYDPVSDSVKETPVLEVMYQGKKPVVDLVRRNRKIAGCTLDHRWHTTNDYNQISKVRKTADINKHNLITRRFVTAPLGSKNEPHAYAIAALLGDGCSMNGTYKLHISSEDNIIPNYVSSVLGAKYTYKNSDKNYTRVMSNTDKGTKATDHTLQCNHYESWCKGKRAHEKQPDLLEIKTWNRSSCLNFLAGLLDTDGSVTVSNNNLSINWFSQSPFIQDTVKYLIEALFMIKPNVYIDKRSKYKNGPVVRLQIKSNTSSKRVLRELSSYCKIERKQYKKEYDLLNDYNEKQDSIGVKVEDNNRIANTWDISIGTKSHLYLLGNGMITHNSFVMCIDILHFMVTTDNVRVLLITPYEKQIIEMMDTIIKLLENSNSLRGTYAHNKSRHELRFLGNNSVIKSLSTGGDKAGGGDKARGQPADMLVFDEIDYVSQSDIEAAIAILFDNPKCRVLMATTPTGKRGFFYNRCIDKALRYKEFHHFSHVSPSVTKHAHEEILASSSTAAFLREILAEFGEEMVGVFSNDDIDKSLKPYKLEDVRAKGPQPNMKYIIGVDWNGRAIGVHIVVVGYNLKTGFFTMCDKIIVRNEQFTQDKACTTIIEAFKYWRANFIYVDAGHGSTQCEIILKHAQLTNDQALAQALVPIWMQGYQEIRNPISGQIEKKPNKEFAVNLLVNRMERGLVTLPKSEDYKLDGDQSTDADWGLICQMRNFYVAKISATGSPKYGTTPDHTLTAFYLAVLGFQMKMSDLGSAPYDNYASVRSNEEMRDGVTVKGVKERAKDNPNAVLPGQYIKRTGDTSIKPVHTSSGLIGFDSTIIQTRPDGSVRVVPDVYKSQRAMISEKIYKRKSF